MAGIGKRLRERVAHAMAQDCSASEIELIRRCLMGANANDAADSTSRQGRILALLSYCETFACFPALFDLLRLLSKTSFDISSASSAGSDDFDDIEVGDRLGSFLVTSEVRRDRYGARVNATANGADLTLRITRQDSACDPVQLSRFLAHARGLAASVSVFGPLCPIQACEEEDGRTLIAYARFNGETLRQAVEPLLPLPFAQALPLIERIANALVEMHQLGLPLLAVGPDSIWIESSLQDPLVSLADAGIQYLSLGPGRSGRAPELNRGATATPASDVYALGELVYWLLSGTQFRADAISSLRAAAPYGWVTPEVEQFVAKLLESEPKLRPQDAEEVLRLLPRRGGMPTLNEEGFGERYEAALLAPWDEQAIGTLENCVDAGVDAERVAQALAEVANAIDTSERPELLATRRTLLLKAGGLLEVRALDPVAAELFYRAALKEDAGDEAARRGLVRVSRQLGKLEELIELLLEQQESAKSPTERAQLMAQIGQIYAEDLHDSEQALVAFGEAFAAEPGNPSHVEKIERVAQRNIALWGSLLQGLSEALSEVEGDAEQLSFMRQLAQWYLHKLGRADLALAAFQEVLARAGQDAVALAGLSEIYRNGQSWAELVQVLLLRADIADVTNVSSAALRLEAADVLLNKLNEPLVARDVYEKILLDHPNDETANRVITLWFEHAQDFRGHVALLERGADGLFGVERAKALCRAAEICAHKLGDDAHAEKLYLAALSASTATLEALKGLDVIYSKQARYAELLLNLEAQLNLAKTSRQQITLWERWSALQEEEYRDLTQALIGCAKILKRDRLHSNARRTTQRLLREKGLFPELASFLNEELTLVQDPNARAQVRCALARVCVENLDNVTRALTEYEQALQETTQPGPVLERLAQLCRAQGDAGQAAGAFERLAGVETDPVKCAEHYLLAGDCLWEAERIDAAIDRYKLALDQDPNCRRAQERLVQAYTGRGEFAVLAEMLELQAHKLSGEHERAMLLGHLARIRWEQLKETDKAHVAAVAALAFDPTNNDARLVAAELAYEAGRFAEAVSHYDHVLNRLDTLSGEHAMRVLASYLDALAQSGASGKVLEVARKIAELDFADLALKRRAADAVFALDAAEDAFELYARILEQHTAELSSEDRFLVLVAYGDSARRLKKYKEAKWALDQAGGLKPDAPKLLESLQALYEDSSSWHFLAETLSRRIEFASGDDRGDLLIKLGDVYLNRLSSVEYAAETYAAALDEFSDGAAGARTALARLMQIYGQNKDWEQLITVIARLARYVKEPEQRAKYLFTAAKVALNEVGNVGQASQALDAVLNIEPHHTDALQLNLKVKRRLGDLRALKEALKKEVEAASQAREHARVLVALDELTEAYAGLGADDKAISTSIATIKLEPTTQRKARLAELYFQNRDRYPQEALASQQELLATLPLAVPLHKGLRQLYTDARNADGAFLACQSLYLLGAASRDEQAFFEKRRTYRVFAAQDTLGQNETLALFRHADVDLELTHIAALIAPAVQHVRAEPPAQLGYDEGLYIAPDTQRPLPQALQYIAEVIGLPAPLCFHNPNYEGDLEALASIPPALVVGQGGISAEYPEQAAAFNAARQLCFQLNGFGVVQLLPNHAVLKAWILGAVKLVSPGFIVPPELTGAAREAIVALGQHLSGPGRDQLTAVVSRWVHSDSSLDLKRWISGVDLTADRLALFFCNDLGLAVEMIQSGRSTSDLNSREQRIAELFRYAVSESYQKARARLGSPRLYSTPPVASEPQSTGAGIARAAP